MRLPPSVRKISNRSLQIGSAVRSAICGPEKIMFCAPWPNGGGMFTDGRYTPSIPLYGSRFGWPIAAAVFLVGTVAVISWEMSARRELIAAANALAFRPIDGRLAEEFDHRPVQPARVEASTLRAMHQQARELRARWTADGAVDLGRLAGAAALLAGQDEEAFLLFGELLRSGTDESDLAVLIRRSNDSALLTDFSALALERSSDGRMLLLAYEAADRAWQLSHTAASGWNRALAAERIGIPEFAARAWAEVVAIESSTEWAREAEEHRRVAAARAAALPDASLELFFYRELITRAIGGSG